MAKLTRVTGKVFGETASTSGSDPEIGQFGSAKAGTYVGTGDVATIQNLAAWSNGWIAAVTPTQQYPTLPEMTGVHKVLSHQSAYILQQGIPEWDSATTYYENSFCQVAGVIYKSKTDENLNNNPTSDTDNWEEFVSGGASRNIGEIVASTIPLTDAGLHLLDGTVIQGSGIYSAFVDYIADIYDVSANYFCTEAEWQQSVTDYGVCGKFVYDSVSNTVRLPLIEGFTESTIDTTVLGDLTEAGLPNITGSTYSYSPVVGVSGAFSSGGSVSTHYSTEVGGSSNYLYLDASRSNSMYGNSGTVQPQSIKVLYYIVVATSTKTDIQVDIDEIATDLNMKVDKSSLVEAHVVIETYSNGSSWYRVYDDGWCEQGGVVPSTSGDAYNKTVTLLKPYVNTDYTVITQFKDGTSNASMVIWTCGAKNLSTSSFQIWNNISYLPSTFWVAYGYIS